tara:strand:+ start:7047 stop:7175 length:129 start_codon:yes stop_codon:yes gene_type:complete
MLRLALIAALALMVSWPAHAATVEVNGQERSYRLDAPDGDGP